jgi:thiol-disulfide isomerase/thioredoxin
LYQIFVFFVLNEAQKRFHKALSLSTMKFQFTPFSQLLAFVFLAIFAAPLAHAQEGYKISVSIDGYREKKLTLGYYFGKETYVKDTVPMQADGSYVFSGKDALPPGVYVIFLTPEKVAFDVLIPEKAQHFAIKTSRQLPHQNVKFTGSNENELFYQYLGYLNAKSVEADTLRARQKRAPEVGKPAFQKKMEGLDAEVMAFLKEFTSKNAGTFAAQIASQSLPVDNPEFKGSETEIQEQRWRHARAHHFDRCPLTDGKMMRSPNLIRKVDEYVNQLTVQHPDSIIQSIEWILGQVKGQKETFEYLARHFLQSYLDPKYIGQDAIFVHLMDKYFSTGLIELPAETKKKLDDHANKLRPVLIGKTVANIPLQRRDGSNFNLYEVDADFTLLFFWDYECGNCKQYTPFLKDFYEKYKNQGVKIVAVCHRDAKEYPNCWKYVDENNTGGFIQACDPYRRYLKQFPINSTPQIFVLNRKKEIVSKQIPKEKLDEVIGGLIKLKG